MIPRPQPRGPEPKLRHYALAALGSVLIGVTLPSLLTAMRLCLLDKYANERVLNFLILQALALLGCGPGAVMLALILMSFLALKTPQWSVKRSITSGALWGVGLAFLNFPGLCVLAFLYDEHEPIVSVLRVALLYVVAGSTCGMWIGWQAWRGFRPSEGFLPRFTLRTMLMIVMLWGTVLVAFQPDRKDEVERLKADKVTR